MKSLLVFIANLFIGFLVGKVACQSRKSDFGWHRFRFLKSLKAILALLDSFQELYLEW